MSFSIQPKTLKRLIDFYYPKNQHEEMKYMLYLKGQDELYMNLETSPFQGISENSIEQRKLWFGCNKTIIESSSLKGASSNKPYLSCISCCPSPQSMDKLKIYLQILFTSFFTYTYLPWNFLFSFVLILIGFFIPQYNQLQISYMDGMMALFLSIVNYVLILIVEIDRFHDQQNIVTYGMGDGDGVDREQQEEAQYGNDNNKRQQKGVSMKPAAITHNKIPSNTTEAQPYNNKQQQQVNTPTKCRSILNNRTLSSEKYNNVWRENHVQSIRNDQIVVGDVIELEIGSIVPADGWIIEGQVEVEEKMGHRTINALKATMKNCVWNIEKNKQAEKQRKANPSRTNTTFQTKQRKSHKYSICSSNRLLTCMSNTTGNNNNLMQKKNSYMEFQSKNHQDKEKSQNQNLKTSQNIATKNNLAMNSGNLSPVIIGGSTVVRGTAKMIVLCVGKLSRKGQFELLVKNREQKVSILQKKLEQISSEIFKYSILALIVVTVILLLKEFITLLFIDQQSSTSTNNDSIFKIENFQHIFLILCSFLMILPQGLLIGLTMGLFLHKKRLLWSENILIKKLVNCEEMSYIQYICHDKEKIKSYFKMKEWWNDGSVQKIENFDGQKQLTNEDIVLSQEAVNDEEDSGHIDQSAHQIINAPRQKKFNIDNSQPLPFYRQPNTKSMNSPSQKVNSTFSKLFRKAMTINISSSSEKPTSNHRHTAQSNRSINSRHDLKYGSFRNLDECFLNYTKRQSYVKFTNGFQISNNEGSDCLNDNPFTEQNENHEQRSEQDEYKVLKEIPYDHITKRTTIIATIPNHLLEEIEQKCTMTRKNIDYNHENSQSSDSDSDNISEQSSQQKSAHQQQQLQFSFRPSKKVLKKKPKNHNKARPSIQLQIPAVNILKPSNNNDENIRSKKSHFSHHHGAKSESQFKRKVIAYVRGKHDTILEMCTHMMSKETGKITRIDEEMALNIKNTVDSMLRRQLRIIVLAFKILTMKKSPSSAQNRASKSIHNRSFHSRQNIFNTNNPFNPINNPSQSSPSNDPQNENYILLGIIGLNDTRSTEQFQLITKLKQNLHINLMISSNESMQDSISAANEIGLIKQDDSSILINGQQFLNIVGGVICNRCKKAICLCGSSNSSSTMVKMNNVGGNTKMTTTTLQQYQHQQHSYNHQVIDNRVHQQMVNGNSEQTTPQEQIETIYELFKKKILISTFDRNLYAWGNGNNMGYGSSLSTELFTNGTSSQSTAFEHFTLNNRYGYGQLQSQSPHNDKDTVTNSTQKNLILKRYQPKIKNIDEFERILKHLDVLSNTQALHKYLLIVGLHNKNISCCLSGKTVEDIPSMLEADVGIYVNQKGYSDDQKNFNSQQKNEDGEQLNNPTTTLTSLSESNPQFLLKSSCDIQIPNSSIHNLYKLIKNSRISHSFVRKYIKLMTISTLVPTLYLLFTLLIWKIDFGIKLSHVLSVQLSVMIWLGLGLAFDDADNRWENEELRVEQEKNDQRRRDNYHNSNGSPHNNHENVSTVINKNQTTTTTTSLSSLLNSSIMSEPLQQKYHKYQPLISQQSKIQIILYTTIQLVLILFITFIGPLFIPEQTDSLDQILQPEEWFAKYSDEDKTIISSGLGFQLGINSDNSTTSSSLNSRQLLYQKYNLYTRHQTIIYTLYWLMQVFTYFTIREQPINKVINVNLFKNLNPISLAIILLIIVGNIFIVENIGSWGGLYLHGLTFLQWSICVGFCMFIWLVGLSMRLFPSIKQSESLIKKRWPNKSYNLAVRAIGNGSGNMGSGLVSGMNSSGGSGDELADFEVDQYFEMKPDYFNSDGNGNDRHSAMMMGQKEGKEL